MTTPFEHVEDSPPADDLIGQAESTRRTFQWLRVAAACDQPVLLTGEVGTGKTRLAAALHQLSERREGPYFRVNCAALTEQELMNDLLDWFQEADGGVLFFDEIDTTPLTFQVKLLQFSQSASAGRMESQHDGKVDVRVVAAAGRDLSTRVTEGYFREDLFWHLSVLPIELPPLRQRREDIEPLVRATMQQASTKKSTPVTRIDPAARTALTEYAFPGNLSELHNYIGRAVAIAPDREITPAMLPTAVTGGTQDAQAVVFRPADDEALIRDFVFSQISKADPDDRELYRRIVDPVEKELLQQVLDACHQTQTQAARRLGINRNTLYKKMVHLELVKPKSETESAG